MVTLSLVVDGRDRLVDRLYLVFENVDLVVDSIHSLIRSVLRAVWPTSTSSILPARSALRAVSTA